MHMSLLVTERTAILAAMAQIAALGGTRHLSAADVTGLQACSRYLFQSELTDWHTLPPILPRQLAERLPDAEQRHLALQLLTVMAFVDGTVDDDKINLVLAYADALAVQDSYIQDLVATSQRHWAWVIADMTRRNIASFIGHPWADGDALDWLLPYRGAGADPELEQRFQALAHLPSETLGHQFWVFYQAQGYAFPGESQGLNAQFAVPHDCTHLLTGYDTSPRGEILVSTFTAALHRQEGMAGHILPVIYSWHLGISFNEVAGATTGALDVAEFWRAWARGEATQVDWFGLDWDFWARVSDPLERVRLDYGVPT